MDCIFEDIGYEIIKDMENGVFLIKLNGKFPEINDFPYRHYKGHEYFLYRIYK